MQKQTSQVPLGWPLLSLLRVKSAFADAGPAHEQATVFAARIYLESMGQAADAQAVTTYDIALNWFGSVMPPATLPNNPAPNVKEVWISPSSCTAATRAE